MTSKEKKRSTYGGVIVPMVTPTTEAGGIDDLHSRKLIRFLHENNTVPFILGTTGEVASIPVSARNTLVDILIDEKKEGTPLIVGMGSLTFNETIELSNRYISQGIDAVVITLPNYFRLNDSQIYRYFYELSRKIQGDIILYNIPATVHFSIPISIVEKLSYIENIVAIKDSENNEQRLIDSLQLWKNREDFVHLVGTNDLMQQGLKLGSSGIVPSSGNLAPALYYDLYKKSSGDDFVVAKHLQQKTTQLTEIYKSGFLLGESIAALKYLLCLENLCNCHVLPPLSPLPEELREHLKLSWDFVSKALQ